MNPDHISFFLKKVSCYLRYLKGNIHCEIEDGFLDNKAKVVT